MKEGADMLMVKPGLPYLDVVRKTKDKVVKTSLYMQWFFHLNKPKTLVLIIFLFPYTVSRFTPGYLPGIDIEHLRFCCEKFLLSV